MRMCKVLLLVLFCLSVCACSTVSRKEQKIRKGANTAIRKADKAIDSSVVGDIDNWQKETLW